MPLDLLLSLVAYKLWNFDFITIRLYRIVYVTFTRVTRMYDRPIFNFENGKISVGVATKVLVVYLFTKESSANQCTQNRKLSANS